MDFDKELDAKGLACPLPVLKTRRALNEMNPGQVLKIVATDSGTPREMQDFAALTGNELLLSSQQNGEYIIFLRKR
ncbi:MAG: sulfurtransferase TusA family protein [Gallionellaceae bacterium]|nr:sulfurtransferase TusA family protein [Gallionellaceae bacterium]